MLPDRSLLMGQKLVENAKTKKIKCELKTLEYVSMGSTNWVSKGEFEGTFVHTVHLSYRSDEYCITSHSL